MVCDARDEASKFQIPYEVEQHDARDCQTAPRIDHINTGYHYDIDSPFGGTVS
jgi:hypothetical protein